MDSAAPKCLAFTFKEDGHFNGEQTYTIGSDFSSCRIVTTL